MAVENKARVEFLTPNWPAPQNIKAISTRRSGGFSHGPYAGLNLAKHVADDEVVVEQNRRALSQALRLPSEPVWLKQVHGIDVAEINAESAKSTPQADASIARSSALVCAIMTADCLPIFLCNTQGTVVAAVHAGWRGLHAGVIENTVEKMGESKDLMAWLGPAISPSCFEVGQEVKQAFTHKNTDMQSAFVQKENGQYLADLYALARTILIKSGVEKIYGGEQCTYNNPDKFFSYRRDAVTGRMASLIWMQS
ncbi:MAG: laccase [Cycloclasticus sp. symbiont of Poecilosclerida sp. M]|nr:MAG: laccase [Cycloclasticus sp. symbiont of Poecilosclerida sp. M]